MFFEPRPGAAIKEVLFDPRNMVLVFIAGIGGALICYSLLLWVYQLTGFDASIYFRI